MIEVQGISKQYGDHRAIDDLSFAIKQGEVVGFLGPNGAGKSTTMRILTGSMPASSGSVRLAGYDPFEAPLKAKRQFGYLPEIPPVILDMTVRAFLAYVAGLKGLARRQIASEIDRVAQSAGVHHIQNRLIRNVSKGYRQRIGLAQALLGNPPILILDEPTVGLDPVQIAQVRETLKDLAQTGDHTIILSTHILSEISATCDRILMIAGGRIVADGATRELEAQHDAPLETVFARLAMA